MPSPVVTEAYVVEEAKAPFVLQQVALDDLRDNEVLVAVKAVGLCQTDLGGQANHYNCSYPAIFGHESAGTVEAVGRAVKRVKVGDTVCCSFASCTQCKPCRRDNPAICADWPALNFGQCRAGGNTDAIGALQNGKRVKGGFFGQSGFARHTIMHETSLVVVPPATDIRLACSLGCGFQTGAGAVLIKLRPEKDSSIAIFGLGAVGWGALLAAISQGIETIIAIDIQQERLELAKELGATATINAAKEVTFERIKELTHGKLLEYAVEATGIQVSINSCFKALAVGGHMIQLGSPGFGHTPPIDIHEAVAFSKTYQGVNEGGSNPPVFIPQLLTLMSEGRFPIDRLAKEYPFEQLDEAIAAMRSGKIIKPILVM